MTWEAWTIETLAGSSPGDPADDRLVADEDEPILGVRAGVVEGARDDLGRAVVAAHRVDGDADAGPRRVAARTTYRPGHRVSTRRRRRRA